ncbi:hypothetical protein [Albidovulum sp.]|uniref:hypothetical protein n=1 Tax=Albidovulum sp. TaxID=1872424 RepID=UPI0039B90737
MSDSTIITGLAPNRLASSGGSPERNLWLAVVAVTIQNDEPEALRRWLRSRDGRLVCSLAGLDPRWVERKWCDEVREPVAAAA